MKTLTTTLALALLALGGASPALADTRPDANVHHNGPGTLKNDDGRHDNHVHGRPDRADDRRYHGHDHDHDRRADWRKHEANGDKREHDDWRGSRNRVDWERDRYRREAHRWDRDIWDYRRNGGRYAYNDYWTPYGFGYHDALTHRWAFYHFDDNRNGKLSKGEWKRAQREFYRFADRNRDGYIDRREYAWVQSYIHGDYRRGW